MYLIGYVVKNGQYSANYDYYKEVHTPQDIEKCKTELTKELINKGHKNFTIQFITKTRPKENYIPPPPKPKIVYENTFKYKTDLTNLIRHGKGIRNSFKENV